MATVFVFVARPGATRLLRFEVVVFVVVFHKNTRTERANSSDRKTIDRRLMVDFTTKALYDEGDFDLEEDDERRGVIEGDDDDGIVEAEEEDGVTSFLSIAFSFS